MSKSRAASAKVRWWNPGWSWKVWAMVVFLLVPTLGFALWVLAEAGGQTKVDPALVGLAGGNADGPVTAITGTEHTIYHASGALPEAKAHRMDGRDTLVWFTNATCEECERELFTHTVMKEFRDHFVFMEKDMGREPAAKRLGVTDAPTFVWLDAEGNELGRFGAVADEAALRAEVEKFLASR